MKKIRAGVIGGGYMGKAHSVAARSVSSVFELDAEVVLQGVAASTHESALKNARAFGAATAFKSGADLIRSDQIDAVIIASPQKTHLEYVTLCAQENKPVLCEKPMGCSLEEAHAIAEVASHLTNLVGYNYVKTPATSFARQLIQSGDLGEIVWFRGEHHEDFLANPGPRAWRQSGEANGTLGDLAGHIIQCAQALCGDIVSVVSDIAHAPQVRQQTPMPDDNDDQAHCLVKFQRGANGMLSFSRVAHGRKMGYAYEVHLTRGAIRFDQEDQNALWIYRADTSPCAGFTKVLAGPPHGDYRHFCQGAGHGTGYQDQIVIEQGEFFNAILEGRDAWPSFNDGAKVMSVIQAIRDSKKQQGWVQPARQI